MNTQNISTGADKTEHIPYDFLGDRRRYLTEKGPKLWVTIMLAVTFLAAISVFLLSTGSITYSNGRKESYTTDTRFFMGFVPYVPAWILLLLRLFKIKKHIADGDYASAWYKSGKSWIIVILGWIVSFAPTFYYWDFPGSILNTVLALIVMIVPVLAIAVRMYTTGEKNAMYQSQNHEKELLHAIENGGSLADEPVNASDFGTKGEKYISHLKKIGMFLPAGYILLLAVDIMLLFYCAKLTQGFVSDIVGYKIDETPAVIKVFLGLFGCYAVTIPCILIFRLKNRFSEIRNAGFWQWKEIDKLYSFQYNWGQVKTCLFPMMIISASLAVSALIVMISLFKYEVEGAAALILMILISGGFAAASFLAYKFASEAQKAIYTVWEQKKQQ